MVRPTTKIGDFRSLHVSVPKETYFYIKKTAMYAECSMTDIVADILENYKKKRINRSKIENSKDPEDE
jgi:predicted glycosyltransferase